MLLEDLLNKYKYYGVTAEQVITSDGDYNKYLSTLEDEVVINNLDKLLDKVNLLCEFYGKRLRINSGYRDPEHNKRVGGAPGSKHTQGLACDIDDPDGELCKFLVDNVDFLKKNGCAIEHPTCTRGWCHFQCVLPKSGNNIFWP